MADTLDIWNAALVDVGRDTISSLTEGSEARRICSAKWVIARDAVIRAFDWRCLAKRATCSLLAGAPAFEWTYQYQIPPDCFAVRSIYADGAASPAFVVEGRALLTNDPYGRVIYTAYDKARDNVAIFDQMLTAALVKCLAAEIAPALKGAERSAQMRTIYRGMIEEAKLASAIEGVTAPVGCDTLLSVR